MIRKAVSVISSLSVLLTSVVPTNAAVDGKPGTFYFRYWEKQKVAVIDEPAPGEVSKDVQAFYIGGVGLPFSERLPLKTEWMDDNWRIVGGTLPSGLEFDPETLTFHGTPTQASSGITVDLEGFDAQNRSVATARAEFGIEVIKGVPVKTDIYAHTGKYKAAELAVPKGVAIETWHKMTAYSPPPGITFSGRFMEGVPAAAGRWSYMVLGKDYRGEVVATFFGTYIVADGPEFPAVKSMVQRLPDPTGFPSLAFDFTAPRIVYPIAKHSEVRYFLEIEKGASLPGSIKSNYDSKNLRLTGFVSQPYDTARIRWRALDKDETVGFSDWFEIGSSDPFPICSAVGYVPEYKFTTGKKYAMQIGSVRGGKGEITFSKNTGALPPGLDFDADTGRIVGTPTKASPEQLFTINVHVANDENVVTRSCSYKVSSVNAGFALEDATSDQARHVRVGKTFSGSLSVTGGIPEFDTKMDSPSEWPEYTITSTTKNADKVTFSGTPSKAGAFSIPFTSTNGDQNVAHRNATIVVHPSLAVGTVETVHAKRLAKSEEWGSVPVDMQTVIPDAVKGGQPKFTVAPQLPAGLELTRDGTFEGTTTAKAGEYGPFTVTVSDFSGDKSPTNTFKIVVEPREEIAVDTLVPPIFTAEWDAAATFIPVTAKQPAGASDFGITHKLNNLSGKPLPTWLAFDSATGAMTAAKGIPFADIGRFGPLSVTMTDDEGSAVTSDQFDISVVDWPSPEASNPTAVRGTVSGNTSIGENATSLVIPSLRSSILPNTVIGGQAGTKFTSSDPKRPAGLQFDPTDGSFSGVPDSEFNGPVKVQFEDAKGRPGTVVQQLEVKGYPKVSTSSSFYELPRLSDADAVGMKGEAKSGFWNQPTWSVDTVTGFDISKFGLSVDARSGLVKGRTDAPVDTMISNVVLLATSRGAKNEPLVSRTAPFSIKVVSQRPLTLEYKPASSTYYMNRDQSGGYSLQSKDQALPSPGGSYVGPLRYSANLNAPGAAGFPSTLAFDGATGLFAGVPDKLGTWEVPILLTDAEGNGQRGGPTNLSVKSTLSGKVVPTNGGGTLNLRVEEPFKTDDVKLTNEVRPVAFTATAKSGSIPATAAVGFDATTGSFSDQSYFASPVTLPVNIDAKDAHGRTFGSPLLTTFRVLPPLAVTISTAAMSVKATQFSPTKKIDVSFGPRPENGIGAITYHVNGTLPGTLVYRMPTESGLGWKYAWTYDKRHYEVSTDGSDVVTEYRIDGGVAPLLPASQGETRPLSDYFQPDALVFDTARATLRGIPSKSGQFMFTVVASDSHKDDYIRDVSTRVSFNTASSQAVILTVDQAKPMEISNTADEEAVAQYTGSPTISTEVLNAAYGAPVTWTQTSGSLPPGVSTSQVGGKLSYVGYPTAKGTFGDIVWTATDAGGRTIGSEPVEMRVVDRDVFTLSSDTPFVMVVNEKAAAQTVTSVNNAYGTDVRASDWTLSGANRLPPGITADVASGTVSFSGTPSAMGRYEGVSVSGRDAVGATASVELVFEVVNPTGPIGVEVSDVTTRADIPFSIAAKATNTYGKVQFYSYDIDGDPKTHLPGKFADDLDIGITSGTVTGRFSSVGDRSFDIYATDATNRLTSKPVTVSVIPDLRLTAPQIVQAQQGSPMTQGIETAYKIGTVTYGKGSGPWPMGVAVDAKTGSIVGYDNTAATTANRVLTGPGTYQGLTISATETFKVSGIQYTQTRISNGFTLQVEPTSAMPDIANPSKTILGTEGTAITDWKAAVVEKGTSKAWGYGGSTYTTSHDLAQYGLSFDRDTGIISGTPTKPFIIRDFVVGIISARGDRDVSNPFWIGVAPKDQIALAKASEAPVIVRRGDAFVSKPTQWENAIGNFTHVKTSGNSTFGVVAATGALTASTSTANWTITDFPVGIRMTDEFNRTATATLIVRVLDALAVSASGIMAPLDAHVSSDAPTVTGADGQLSFTATGLPNGWSIDPATGVVSGTLTAELTDGGKEKWPYTVKVTDSSDGKTASAAASIFLDGTGYLYFRIFEPRSYGYWGCMFIDIADPSGSKINTATGVSASPYAGRTKQNMVTKVSAPGDGCQLGSSGGVHFMQWNFARKRTVASVKTTFDNTWNMGNSFLRAPQFQASDDGENWTTIMTGGPNNKTGGVTYNMPL